jgi:hypothetical protein
LEVTVRTKQWEGRAVDRGKCHRLSQEVAELGDLWPLDIFRKDNMEEKRKGLVRKREIDGRK